jgi:membrane dipeptidase
MCSDDIASVARNIHFTSIVFDTHADTPQRFLFDRFDLGHRDAGGGVDIPRMREGGVGAIFFALWVPVHITGSKATRRALDLLDATLVQIRQHPNDLMLATSSEEVRAARAQGKIAVLLGVEGGHAIDNNLDVLRDFFARGVRYMTLTHNAATDWADSSNQSPRHQGLTDFGREVIEEMNRLGMLIDLSHVSDQTFYDVLEISRASVIASHSCCRAICNAPRNLSDDMIKALAAHGGVVHITFHNAFLSQQYADATQSSTSEWRANLEAIEEKFGDNEARKLAEGQRLSDAFTRAEKLPEVTWEKIIEHIDHAIAVAGAAHVGMGSDFDGAFMPEGMEDASKFPKITESLLRRGHSESDVRKILGENTLRVMARTERVAHEIQMEKV